MPVAIQQHKNEEQKDPGITINLHQYSMKPNPLAESRFSMARSQRSDRYDLEEIHLDFDEELGGLLSPIKPIEEKISKKSQQSPTKEIKVKKDRMTSSGSKSPSTSIKKRDSSRQTPDKKPSKLEKAKRNKTLTKEVKSEEILLKSKRKSKDKTASPIKDIKDKTIASKETTKLRKEREEKKGRHEIATF